MKKAQVWSLDIIVGVTIFIIAIIIFYIYTINLSDEAESSSEDLSIDADFIASNILSEGSPSNWNKTNVLIPGILTGFEINQTKLDELYNLTYSNYPEGYRKVSSLIGNRFDFYFYFNNEMNILLPNGSTIIPDGIGKLYVNRTNLVELENPANIAKIERFTAYQKKPTKLTLIIWNK
ncbi:hypothetical protein HYV49_05030 [Candidatus Pacearchaeota archaeon]|nr:hypothetical protein [Candidatus Pacearchaeota archaeon]